MIEFYEIFKLKRMLENAKIPFEFNEVEVPMQKYKFISYPNYKERICNVSQVCFNYKDVDTKLAIIGLLTAEEMTDEEKTKQFVKGWLTAEDVFVRIQNHFIKQRGFENG